jgi:hypothetical protein
MIHDSIIPIGVALLKETRPDYKQWDYVELKIEIEEKTVNSASCLCLPGKYSNVFGFFGFKDPF